MGKQRKLNKISNSKVDTGETIIAGISRGYYFGLSLFLLFISIGVFVERPGASAWAWGALALSIVLFVFALFASDKAILDAGPSP